MILSANSINALKTSTKKEDDNLGDQTLDYWIIHHEEPINQEQGRKKKDLPKEMGNLKFEKGKKGLIYEEGSEKKTQSNP